MVFVNVIRTTQGLYAIGKNARIIVPIGVYAITEYVYV